MDIKNIWVRPLANSKDKEEMDGSETKRMWRVFYKGRAIADVEDVNKWLDEQFAIEAKEGLSRS